MDLVLNLLLQHSTLDLIKSSTKALTKYERPKMKRDAHQKILSFLQLAAEKKAAFWAGFFFHFRPFVFC